MRFISINLAASALFFSRAVAICFVLRCAPCVAQSFDSNFESKHRDFFDLLFYDPSDLSVKYTNKPRPRMDNESRNAELSQIVGNADVPIPLANDSVLFLDWTYERNDFEFAANTPVDSRFISATAQSFETGFGLGHFVSDDLLIMGLLYPSLRSDFETSISSDDFQLETGGSVVYRTDKKLSFQLGGVAIVRSYAPEAYPLLGVSYRSNDQKFRLNITAPFSAYAGYRLHDELELYTSYEYSDEEFRANIGHTQFVDSQIRIRDAQIAVGLTANLVPHTFLSLEGGVALGTGYRIHPKDFPAFGGNFDSTPFVAVRLGYSFP